MKRKEIKLAIKQATSNNTNVKDKVSIYLNVLEFIWDISDKERCDYYDAIMLYIVYGIVPNFGTISDTKQRQFRLLFSLLKKQRIGYENASKSNDCKNLPQGVIVEDALGQNINNKDININRNKKENNIKEKVAAEAATNEQRLQERKNKFMSELAQYVAVYGDKTIRDFANYWTEANRSNTKMRYEMQPTWNTAMRLATWARREQPESTPQRRTGKTAPMQAFENMMQKFSQQQKTEDIEFETVG